MNKIPLAGKTLDELKAIVAELNMPGFTAKQISEWLYKKRAFSIDEMTNISAKNRATLNEQYEVGRTLPVQVMESVDGTKKYLFKTPSGHFVETVYIPDEESRHALCVIASGMQNGMFVCMTGKQGFIEQLTATEIMNQIMSYPKHPHLQISCLWAWANHLTIRSPCFARSKYLLPIMVMPGVRVA